MREKKFLIAYDVCDNRRRRYVVKHLEDYAYRIQYSVFEMSGSEEAKNKLVNCLLDVMDEKEDSLLVYELDMDSWTKTEKFGRNIDGLSDDPIIL